MKLISVTESDKPDKKMMAKFEQDSGRTKTIHFGAIKNGKKMDDYTITHDKEQRARYIARHDKNEDWSNPMTAGALSRFILWGDSTSRAKNISSYRRKFNL